MMSNLFDKIANSESKIQVKPPFYGYVINFSNTRDNWFALTIDQLLSVLTDMKHNMSEYKNNAGNKYIEANYRTVFERTLSDDVVRALSTVQTLPLFTLIAQIIHYSSVDSPYIHKDIALDSVRIDTAIQTLQTMRKAAPAKVLTNKHGPRLEGGQNRIYYGAPGTGKSYSVDKEAGSGVIFRTVFHPDMQNSDFFETLCEHDRLIEDIFFNNHEC